MTKGLTREIDEEVQVVGEDIIFIFRLLVAFVFIVIGFIGIILPVIPDWPLLLVGIVLLDTHGRAREKILEKCPQKYKKTLRKILFFFKVKANK